MLGPKIRSRLHWQTATAILAIAVCGLIRLPVTTETFWNIDEAVSACVANTILQGGVPYRDSIDHRGPGTYYIYALVFGLFGKNNMDAVHVALALVVTGIAGLLWWISFRFVNRRVGLFTVSIFGLLSFVPFHTYDMLAANTEWFQTAFTVSGVVLLLVGLTDRRDGFLFLSGICYGLGYLCKQPALFDFAGAIGYLVLAAILGRSSSRVVAQRVAFLVAGFLAINGTVIAYFAMRSALSDFIFCFWTYNTKYYLPAVPVKERIEAYERIVIALLPTFPVYIFLFIIGTAQQSYRFLCNPCERSGEDYQFLFVCWALSSWIGTLLSGRDFGHYFIQVLPGVAIVSALALDNAVDWTRAFLRRLQADGERLRRHARYLWARVVLIVLLVGLVAPAGNAVWRFVGLFDREKPLLTLSVVPGRSEDELVAAIRELALPHTPIFIWGWYTELYVLTDRDPASQYTTANLLTGMIPWQNLDPETDTSFAIIPGARETLMRQLSKRRPTVIIDTSPGNFRFYGKYPLTSFLALSDFVRREYALAREVRDEKGSIAFRIYQRLDVPTAVGEAAPLDYGRKIGFGRGGDSGPFRLSGWSEPEENYTWTLGGRSSLAVRVVGTKVPMMLKMKLIGFYKAPALPFQPVDVFINGEKVGEWKVAEERVYALRIPEKFLATDGVLVINFAIPKAVSPNELGYNADTRPLGFRCSEMEISPEAEAATVASADQRSSGNGLVVGSSVGTSATIKSGEVSAPYHRQ